MDLKKYRAFIAVMETRSVSAAAELLGESQPALTQTLNALEKQFGFKLVMRSRSGVKLTNQGRRIYSAVKKVIEADDALQTEVKEAREDNGERLRVAIFKSVAVNWLPAMIKAFRQKRPNVEFSILDGAYAEVDEYIRSGAADVGFVSLPDELDCEFIPICKDRLMAVLPEGHPLAENSRVPVTAFGTEPVISLIDSTNKDAARVLASAGVKPSVSFRTADDYAMIAMVENGLGICIAHELLLRGTTHNVQIRELDPPAHRTIALALPDYAQAAPLTKEFIDFVREWTRGESGHMESQEENK